MAYEIAARSSFDLGDRKSGLDQAHQSLVFLPENPLLLVAVADVQAREHQNDSAISSVRDALNHLDRFTRPIAIAEHAWPEIKRNQQAIARFVVGRPLIRRALQPAAQPGQLVSIRPRPPFLSPVLSTSPMLRPLTCLARIISSPMI
jgi:hypothetical protein